MGLGWGFGADDALCARCGGRVSDGGCSTCRLSRQQLEPRPLPAGPVLLLAAVLLLLLLALA